MASVRPRFTIMLRFSKRCTMPLTSCPSRPLNSLYNILFGCLCGDTAECARVQFAQELVADLGIRIKRLSSFLQGHLHSRILHIFDHSLGLEELYLTDLRIELGLDLPLMTEGFFGRGDHGIFQGIDENRLVDAFFFAHLFNDSIEILLHIKRSNRDRNSTFQSWKMESDNVSLPALKSRCLPRPGREFPERISGHRSNPGCEHEFVYPQNAEKARVFCAV